MTRWVGVSQALSSSYFPDTFELGDNTKINLNSDGSARFMLLVTSNDFVQKGLQAFSQVTNPNNNAALGLKLYSEYGSGIGIRSVNRPGSDANLLNTNCPRFVFSRCTNSTGKPQFDDDNKLIKTDFVPCNVGATLGELNWSTSQGEQDLYLARFTAYNKAKGGELELSLYNTETDLDYQYYFDSQGFLGLRFDGKDEFFINVDQNNSQTKFKTTKDRLNFQSATGTYSFNTPDFSSSLNIKADTDFIGFTTSISNDAGYTEFDTLPIEQSVSLIATVKFSLGTNGAINFIKGSDQITITPGGTGTPSSSNGTINATSFSSIKVKLNTFGNNNSRPIACFGTRVDSEDPLTTTYAGLATPANRDISPLVNGTDGKFVVQYIETKDSSKTNIFNGSAQFTGQVELPGGGGPTQAVTRGEVETMIDGLTPGPGVGDITSVIMVTALMVVGRWVMSQFLLTTLLYAQVVIRLSVVIKPLVLQ